MARLLAPACLAVVSALVLLTRGAEAQRPRIEIFPPGNGVPTTAIVDLEQDASGRLWIMSRELLRP